MLITSSKSKNSPNINSKVIIATYSLKWKSKATVVQHYLKSKIFMQMMQKQLSHSHFYLITKCPHWIIFKFEKRKIYMSERSVSYIQNVWFQLFFWGFEICQVHPAWWKLNRWWDFNEVLGFSWLFTPILVYWSLN